MSGKTAHSDALARHQQKAGIPMAKRILIADDEHPIADMYEQILMQEGYSTRKTTQALRFYDEVREFHPHLILLDLMMPYLDGADELRLLSLSPDTSGIAVLMITADKTAIERESEYLSLGISRLIIKPVDIDVLVGAVRDLIGAPNEEG